MSIFEKMMDIIVETYSNELPLAAIYLPYPLKTSKGFETRIRDGHGVCVRDGRLVDWSGEEEQYVIEKCMGTVAGNRHYLILRNFKTNQELKLDLV